MASLALTAAADVIADAGDAAIATCRHCGDPCRGSAVRSAEGAFCCGGCHAVFTLLRTHGLTDYYGCETAGVSQRTAGARQPDRFAALDDPQTAARFLDFDDGIVAGASFSVPGLHCASCIWLLERLWRIDSHILRAEADLVRRTVSVWFSPDAISLRGVAERLAEIGYEPAIDGETRRAAMPPSRRRLYIQLGVAGFAFGNIMLFSIPRYVSGAPLDVLFERLFGALNLMLGTTVLLVSARDYFRSSWQAVRAGRMSLDIPVAIGLAALYGRSAFEVVTARGEGFMDSFTGLVLFLLVGRLFQ